MAELPSSNVSRRRRVLAWCCYDWANSGYTTLIITVFVVYLQRVVFEPEKWGNVGPIMWAWGISASMLVGAILSPVLGALADARSSKRVWLGGTAICGGLMCVAMALIPPEYTWAVALCFPLANLALELSLTVYNGFLPEIANDQEMNRVSSLGMGLGYLGGGLALVLAIGVLAYGHRLGLPEMSARLRCCIAGTGIWWMLFTIPTLIFLKDKRPPASVKTSSVAVVKRAVKDAVSTLFQIRRYSVLALFLVSFLFFNDGVQTVISQASTFALQELDFLEGELVRVTLMIQFLALPGAILLGWLADRIGQKPALILCLIVWVFLLISAWFVTSKTAFWIMAAGVALVLGGTQAISRAIMGVLTPEQHAAQFFGFFNLSGKATSFMGTFAFGLVIAWTGSSRIAIVNLLAFFLIGLLLVFRVDLKRGIRERNAHESSRNSFTQPTT